MGLWRGDRLVGRTVILATGAVPDHSDFTVPEFGGWDIDQAVIGLARAVLAEGGEIAFDGDAATSTLLAMIAGEYQTLRFAESAPADGKSAAPRVRIYRSGERSDRAAHDEALLERLRLISLDPAPGAVADARPRRLDDEDPAALVCIGGDGRVLEQVRDYADRFPYRPLFALAATGGAAARLGQDPLLGVEIVDLPVLEAVRSRVRDRLESDEQAVDRRRAELELKVVPYPLVMQIIVDRIIGAGKLKAL